MEECIENVEKPKSSSRISVVKIASTQSPIPERVFLDIYFINLFAPQLKGIKVVSVEVKMKSVKMIRLKNKRNGPFSTVWKKDVQCTAFNRSECYRVT